MWLPLFFSAHLFSSFLFLHGPAAGSLRLEANVQPREWTVNEAGVLELTVEIREGRLEQGDRIAIHIPGSWVMHGFRPDERDGRIMGNQPYSVLTEEVAEYFEVTSGGAEVEWGIDLGERYHDGTYHRFARELQLEIAAGNLDAGQRLTVRYGSGSRPIHASVLAETVHFLFRVSQGNDHWHDVGSVPVTTQPKGFKKLLLTGGSTARVGEPVHYHVTARDRLGNAAALPEGLEIRLPEAAVAPRFQSRPEPFQEFYVRFLTPGFHQVEIGNEAVGYVRSNPVRVAEEEPELRLYWGDLHSHSEISKDGIGSGSFEFARDFSNLDFFASTEHTSGDRDEIGITDAEWEEIQAAVRNYHQPGRFVTLLGYECSFPHPYGHHNVYFDGDEAPLYRDNEVRTLGELWELLASRRAFTVPHHTGIRFGGTAGPGASAVWDRDHPLRPLIEIYSGHGQSERFDPNDPLSYDQLPFFQRWKNWFPRHAPDTSDEYRTVSGPTSVEGPHYAQDAWAAGLKMGTVAASDDHTARPGQPSKGLTAVWAPALDRGSIFGSLFERRAYGTTGQRIYLDFRINGEWPGSRIQSSKPPVISLEVHGTDDLEWVELVRFDDSEGTYQILERWAPGTVHFSASKTDPTFSGSAFYYVRLQQRGPVEGRPARAWSSPIWVSSAGVDLPELPSPQLQLLEPAVQETVRAAYQRAQERPEDARMNGELAMVLHAHRQFEAAELCYGRALLLEPEGFRWHYFLGLVRAELGRHTEAVETFREAVRLNPKYLPARLKMAESLMLAGQLSESRALYEELLRENPDSPLVHFGLGRVKLSLQDRKEAVRHLTEACKLFPAFGAAHYSLGLIYRDLDRDEDARAHLSLYQVHRHSRPRPDDPLLEEVHSLQAGARHYLEWGLRLQAQGRYQEAVAAHEKVLELDPRRAQAHLNLLSAHLELGNLEQAERHYRAALELAPDLAEVHFNYGLLLGRQERPEEAARAFRRALEINPFYAEAHNNLGFLLSVQGKLEEAEGHFRLAVRHKPDYRLARYNLARVFLRRERPQEAVDQLLRTVEVKDEQVPLYLYTLADAYARAGRLEEAVDAARRAQALALEFSQTDLARRIEGELERIGKAGPQP